VQPPGRAVVRDLRELVLGKYLRLPTARFDEESVPVIVSRLNFDTDQVAQASSDALKMLVTDALAFKPAKNEAAGRPLTSMYFHVLPCKM